MASFTDTWNATFEALPPDVGEAINLGPDRIRDHKLAVRQRMEIDHKWDEAADPTHHGKHAKISWFEQASEPGNPDAGTAVSAGFAIPSDAEAGSGILTKDNGANEWRQGIDGGVNQLTNADHNFSASNAWAVGQLLIMTPTAARLLTLPTIEVGRGWFVDIVNLATGAPQTLYITVKSSDGSELRRVLPGQSVRFMANVGTPTTELHWEFPGGVIFATDATVTADVTLYTLPANLVRADGQALRITGVLAGYSSGQGRILLDAIVVGVATSASGGASYAFVTTFVTRLSTTTGAFGTMSWASASDGTLGTTIEGAGGAGTASAFSFDSTIDLKFIETVGSEVLYSLVVELVK